MNSRGAGIGDGDFAGSWRSRGATLPAFRLSTSGLVPEAG
jgi:hypothetical protein